MKKLIVAFLVGMLTLSSVAGTAFAANVPEDTKAAMDQVKAKKVEIDDLRASLQEKREVLKSILDNLRTDAGIVPLTDEEKALYKSVKDEVMPLVDQLNGLRSELKDAVESSDKERADAIRQQISDLKAQISEKWDSTAELRDKVKSNREKAKTFITDDIKSMLEHRRELRQQALEIRDQIKSILNDIRTAKSESDFETVNLKIEQLLEVMTSAEQNISGRMEIVGSLIANLSE